MYRAWVTSTNGLAAILIIWERWAEAADLYREVLASAEENVGHFKTDSLQRLHALHNLLELLQAGWFLSLV